MVVGHGRAFLAQAELKVQRCSAHAMHSIVDYRVLNTGRQVHL